MAQFAQNNSDEVSYQSEIFTRFTPGIVYYNIYIVNSHFLGYGFLQDIK